VTNNQRECIEKIFARYDKHSVGRVLVKDVPKIMKELGSEKDAVKEIEPKGEYITEEAFLKWWFSGEQKSAAWLAVPKNKLVKAKSIRDADRKVMGQNRTQLMSKMQYSATRAKAKGKYSERNEKLKKHIAKMSPRRRRKKFTIDIRAKLNPTSVIGGAILATPSAAKKDTQKVCQPKTWWCLKGLFSG